VGATLALASDRLGQRWLVYVGLGLLAASLMLPSAPGQTLEERIANLGRHLPGGRLFRRRD
jgi:hypothetical protein